MLIDFHVHAFADSIAARAMEKLSNTAKIIPHTDGTVADTVKKQKEWGIGLGVLLPIATKPSQQNTINNWAAEVGRNFEEIIPFGSVHPYAEDALEELERIKALGLKGIKLHPDYQGFFIDDPKAFRIYEKCAELSLPVVFHAGFDAVSPDVIHALPKASLNAHRAVPQMTMILAHMGGARCWDDVEQFLVGEDIYFDISFTAGEISSEQAKRIIKNHGADKILFASDCPWSCPLSEINLIECLGLSDAEKEMIYHKNAEKLLGL